MTIFYTFRYFPSSIVVILDYQFQGSVSSVIAMVPIIKQISKRRCKKSIHRAKNKTFRFTIFSKAGSCLGRTLCFFVLTLVHCHSHARLSILRLGECLFRNFSTLSINPIAKDTFRDHRKVQILFSGTELAHIWAPISTSP